MRVILIATMLIFASSASAGLYKWVDSEGNVHYSQKRPRDQEYTRLKAPAEAPENSKPLYQSTKITTTSNDTIANEKAKTEKLREINCKNAKENLNKYTLYRRFRDKDGNVTVVDDKERARQITISKEAINDFCQ